MAETGTTTESWSPARIFLLVGAIVHIPLGVVGLFYNQSFPIGASATKAADSDLVLGIWETNGWHSLAALLLGIVMTYFTVYPRLARDIALVIGLFHVGLVASLALWDPSNFWLASNDADQVVHSLTAIGGIGSALLTRPLRTRAAISTP